jgi:methionyl-tRNA formyltransferase
VDQGIDTGPIQGIGWLEVDEARSLLWHVVNTYRPGIDLFLDMLAGLRRGVRPEPRAQDGAQRVYGSLPDAGQFQAFRQGGWRLYDPGEYKDLLNGFMPPGVTWAADAMAAKAGEGVGASCCCAHA